MLPAEHTVPGLHARTITLKPELARARRQGQPGSPNRGPEWTRLELREPYRAVFFVIRR